MMKTIIATLIPLLASGTLVLAQEKTKIAVMDLGAKQGVSEQVTASLTDLLTTEISQMAMFSVINRDDMQAMLAHLADKQLLGCDDTKCLVAIGGALGAEMLLSGNIGKVGNTYVINIKLLNIEKAEVLNRISDEFTGDEAGLIKTVKTSVNKLLLSEAYRQKRMFRKVAIGAAIGAAAIGGYCAYKGNDLYKNSYLPAVGHSATVKALDEYKQMDLLRNIFLGLSGACIGATIYLSF